MTRADSDFFVPILRSILIIILKEESFEFTTKMIAEGHLFMSLEMSFQHLAPK